MRVQEPLRPALRRLINALLPTDSVFTAFCIDHFPAVAREFTNGLTRTDKTNLLLEQVAGTLLLQRLQASYANTNVQAEHDEIVASMPLAERQAGVLRAELEQMYLLREQRMLSGINPADLDARIVQLKRAQRSSSQRKEGDLLGDRYWLQCMIGKGGYARVWQSFDRVTRRLVALKILHSDLSEDTRRLDRFRRGVAKLRTIHHPHIVSVYSEIQQDGDATFVAMEYLPGGDLQHAVAQRKLSRSAALRTIIQICDALTFLHASGMIHRDVKPQNILLTGEGVAKLADFDLVWAVDTTGATRTGSLGTFVYAAPEAMVDGSDATCRADVYSLAMTLLFVLHGRALPVNIHYSLGAFIDSIDASAKLKALLKRATQVDPARRTATVQVLRSELLQATESLWVGSAAPSAMSPVQGESIRRAKRLPHMVFTLMLLLMSAGGAAYWWSNLPPPVDAEGEAARLLVDVNIDMKNKRWSEAVAKANRVLSNPAVSAKTRDSATSRRARADQESRVEPTYEKFLSSGENYDQALALYREIPADSVYHASARENYDKLFPLFVEKHLKGATDARTMGKCDDFRNEVKVVLDVDPKQVKALQARDLPCGNEKSTPTETPTVVAYNDHERTPRVRPDKTTTEPPQTTSKPPAEVNTAEADATLSKAQTEYVNGNFSQAINEAKSVQRINPTRAWRIIGAAACNMKNIKLANEAFLNLETASRQYLIYTCQRQGITNTGSEFKLAE